MDNGKILCQFCNNQHGKYICPRCNQRYCSLICYRSQIHLKCSEFFYKDNVEQEIRNRKITEKEKTELLHFLSKYSYNDDFENLKFLDNKKLPKKEKKSTLKDRMKNIDIGKLNNNCIYGESDLFYNIENASFEEIWERLESNEREEFVHLAMAYNNDIV
ncbi:hypothetical protein T552_01396 [Pneumocystis carinii B80]|uniref:HIT-type domain-containing protein n=1 Tax=Pneumocystis carinii (strain B80) TaxID=1408658 RepID=A0A0W4ZK61_PNEC8|nr:hypothetical protein T552_01396 [Pneumocystis carinii B80]KTW28766.1 hypothetical protein T552_01396 [Pneumocystis carinii B80]